jgi:hypothetical protein
MSTFHIVGSKMKKLKTLSITSTFYPLEIKETHKNSKSIAYPMKLTKCTKNKLSQ